MVQDFPVEELQRALHADGQLLQVQPRMPDAANRHPLRLAFENQLERIRDYPEQLYISSCISCAVRKGLTRRYEVVVNIMDHAQGSQDAGCVDCARSR